MARIGLFTLITLQTLLKPAKAHFIDERIVEEGIVEEGAQDALFESRKV